MAQKTGIGWTSSTWSPVVNCTKCSPECKNCYMFDTAKRINASGKAYRKKHGKHPPPQMDAYRKLNQGPQMVPESMNIPRKWKKGRMIFVCSMSDLFHADIEDWYIKAVFQVMNECPQHTFQVLTKRSDRLAQIASQLTWTDNIWIGVSVGVKKSVYRIHDLQTVKQAKVRFLSVEPLLENIPNMPLDGIDWVICGGESGSKHRPMDLAWARSVRDQVLTAKIPFFFKQIGGRTSKANGKILDGNTHCDFPYHAMP